MPVSRNRRKKKSGAKPNVNRQVMPIGDKRLLNKIQSSDIFKNTRIVKNAFGVKVSELILEYGEDLIEPCRTEEDFRKFVPFVILCWNTALLPEEEREKEIPVILKKLKVKEIEAGIRSLIDRKLKYYDQYKFFVGDHEITMLKDGGMHLSVASFQI